MQDDDDDFQSSRRAQKAPAASPSSSKQARSTPATLSKKDDTKGKEIMSLPPASAARIKEKGLMKLLKNYTGDFEVVPGTSGTKPPMYALIAVCKLHAN